MSRGTLWRLRWVSWAVRGSEVAGPGEEVCHTVLFGTCVNYARARVRELGQFDAVLLAEQSLAVGALLDVVYLDRLVALGRHEQLAGVVEVERQDTGLRPSLLEVFAAEQLEACRQPLDHIVGNSSHRLLLTFVGRNVLMTSLSCDVAPPGAREIWSELPLGVADPEASISIGVEAMVAI